MPVRSDAMSRLRDALLAGAVFAMGLIVTYGVVRAQDNAVRAETQARFEGAVERVVYDVQRRINQARYGLRGMAAAYAAVGELSADQFRDHVAARSLATEFPGVLGFGFIQRVPRAELDHFVAAVQATQPDFHVVTSGEAPDLFVVKNIEPAGPNRAVLGYDLGQEAIRREALERAVDAGSMSLSGRVGLVQDAGRRRGWLMIVPVYRPGAEVRSVQERRSNLLGLLYAPILVADVLNDVKNTFETQVDFRLFDGPIEKGLLLFDTDDDKQVEFVANTANAYADRMIRDTRQLEIGGHLLTLQLASTPELEASTRALAPRLFAGLGTVLSLLLGLLVWQLMGGRKRAEAIARSMTADLARLAQVVEHTSNSVLAVDRQLRATWVNEGFTRILGFAQQEVLGRAAPDLLGDSSSRQAHRAALEQVIASGEVARTELRRRASDGSEVWMETELLPTRDDTGAVIGCIEIGLDITQRKLAEQRLTSSQSFLEQAEQIASVGGWEVNLETQEVRLSRQTLRIFELPEDSTPSIEQFIEHFDPADREEIERSTVNAIKTGAPWDLELHLVTAKGRGCWVRTVGRVEQQDGRSMRLLGTLQDVSERRAMEEELRVRNSRFQAILDNLPCGLSVFDADLRLVTHNRPFAELLDLPEEMFNRAQPIRFEDIVRASAAQGEYGSGEEMEARIQQVLERARTLSTSRFEMQRQSGRHLEVHRAPMPGGGFVSAHVDITDRKQAEEALQASEDLMRVVTDNIPGRVGYWDRDMRGVFVNRAYSQTFGKTHEQIIGRTLPAVIGPELYEAYRNNIRRALAGEAQTFERDEKDADGTIRTMLVHYMPDERHGEVQGFFVLALDITELKMAREAARQASAAKGQFLANTSHEIRTPMNAVIGMLTLLQSTTLTARQLDYVKKAEGAARSLLALLNDILDFSKVEAGKLQLDPRDFSLDALLRDLSVILAANLRSDSVEVLFDVDPAIPAQLFGDDMRLRQVLINLGGNAIKFTEKGDVVIAARRVAGEGDGVSIEFSVRDTGIGISPEQHARIFEGFSQAEASTVRRFGGTGLGLAISQRLVQLMGGKLEMQSEPGRGSRFFFTLTLTPPAETPPAPAAARPTMRALFIDDNPVARRILAAQAQTLGWQAETASSGLEGIERLKAAKAPFDAVFVDWLMPGMDGLETSHILRSLPELGNSAMVIMVTAQGRMKFTERGAQDHAVLDGYLVKPVTASMLQQALAEARGEVPTPGPVAEGNARPLEGLTILVVEDNRNNQQVAKELLEGKGAHVEVAGDGLEAVGKITGRLPLYDLVLMDVQMPVMDGYEATRRIRSMGGFEKLPIVAMTANTMTGDRDTSLAAGMNDHVGKPFDLTELVEVIRSHVGGNATDGSPPPASPAIGKIVVKPVAVDLDGALKRLGGDLAFYRKLYPQFRDDTAGMIEAFGRAISEGQRDVAGRLAHTVKGLSATVGATALSRVAGDAEQAMTRAGGDYDASLAGSMQSALAEACAALEAELATRGVTARTEP